ncbi:MAG: Permease of the drug/metabolite transporter (DMT) superfamily, partial [uncultured Cytophagales bacterium]
AVQRHVLGRGAVAGVPGVGGGAATVVLPGAPGRRTGLAVAVFVPHFRLFVRFCAPGRTGFRVYVPGHGPGAGRPVPGPARQAQPGKAEERRI